MLDRRVIIALIRRRISHYQIRLPASLHRGTLHGACRTFLSLTQNGDRGKWPLLPAREVSDVSHYIGCLRAMTAGMILSGWIVWKRARRRTGLFSDQGNRMSSLKSCRLTILQNSDRNIKSYFLTTRDVHAMLCSTHYLSGLLLSVMYRYACHYTSL